jgi:hypothetical protein
MQTAQYTVDTPRYARCVEVSKRIRWEIERDVIRGRSFDFSKKFLPDGLSKIDRLSFLSEDERRFLSQIQGRTYANMFGLVERFIGAKLLELTLDEALGDQVVVEALVRSTDEELKHQALFRRLETMMAVGMPAGYNFVPQPNAVANAVLGKSTWAVLGLTCHIELFTLEHYRQSIDGDASVSELWKDVFYFHMKEESQHAILDELEWQRENARLDFDQRDAALTDLIDLVGAVDGLLQMQAEADAAYFAANIGRPLDPAAMKALRQGLLRAYRWQYIVTGAGNERFTKLLAAMVEPHQMQRVVAALAPIVADVGKA